MTGGFLGRHLRPLRDQRDAAVEEMAAAVQDQVADYRTFDTPEEEADWAATLGLLLDLFLTLAGEDRWLAPAEAHAIRAIGATRADQGFEVGPIRASVRIAVGVARTRVISEYEPAGHDDRAAMQRVLTLLDRFSHTVEDLLQDGYDKRKQQRRTHASEGAGRLVHDVLEGTVVDDTAYFARATSIKCDPKVGRGIFLTPDGDQAVQVAAMSRRDLPGIQAVNRQAPTKHGVVIVPVPLPANWANVLRHIAEVASSLGTTVLSLGHVTSPLDVHLGYVGSVALLPYLARIAGGKPILHGSELTLHRLVASLPEPVRASLEYDVFRNVDACEPAEAATHVENLGLFVQQGFRAPKVREVTGRHLRTVYSTRRVLSSLTSRSLIDPANQTVLTLAFVARQLNA